MPHTLATVTTRASSSGNPISIASVVVLPGETLLTVALKVVSGTNRAGGSLTWGGYTLTQANSTQKAATSPEASAELWYLVNPLPGTFTLTIPNTGGLTIYYHIARASAKPGGTSFFRAANGSNGISANPSPGAIACEIGDIVFAAVSSGATTWNPTAQAGTGYGGTGTSVGNWDDGQHGGGVQYKIVTSKGSETLSWTQASDDWGAVAAAFGEIEPHSFNNYFGLDAGDGVSVTEKIR